MATRIIVKNLPPHLTDDGLKRHFGLDVASTSSSSSSAAAAAKGRPRPSDAKLQKSRDGRSRRFGFVGYATAQEAQRAVDYWHRTFVGSTRITAELARAVGDSEADADGQSVQRQGRKDAEDVARTERESRKRKRGADGSGRDREEDDPELREFMKIHEARGKAKTFLNDDDMQQVDSAPMQSTSAAQGDDDPDEEEYQVLPVDEEKKDEGETDEVADEAEVEDEVIRKPRVVSEDADDDDWLRSRTSRALDLEDGRPASQPKAKKMTVKVANANEAVTDPAQVKAAAKAAAIERIADTKRLFLRNLSFDVTEQDLTALFSSFGAVADAHMPVARDTSRPTGTAFVLFDRSDEAVAAFERLDGTDYRGRLLHILPAAPPLNSAVPVADAKKKNVGSKRQEERRKGAASERYAWNSLYLNQDAVLEQVASRFSLTKADLVQPDRTDAAVTMALAEASVLARIKSYFAEHGVDLASFAGSRERDDRILLFKNLPSGADERKVRDVVEGAGGEVLRCLVPEAGGLGLVEVKDAPMGKSVFAKLAYRKFPGADSLIYLEKGPVDAFSSAPTKAAKADEKADEAEEAADDVDGDGITSVFVKNLNFDTRSDDLTRPMQSLPGFRNATVKTKPDPKTPGARLSMGFGFIEFATERDARRAIDVMQGFKLDGHALELKVSDGKTDDARRKAKKDGRRKASTKVVVKNLPFETSRHDVQRLFAAHGKLKACRLPKKVDAHLRGFAFLEFVSKGEAENAVTQLEGTHLLGRRLVIEYAREDADADVAVVRLVAKTASRTGALKSAEHGTRKIGKVKLDVDELDRET